MPVDVKKFLDELGATGEDRAAVEQFFAKNDTAASKLKDWGENGLRQSDYSRRMDGLKATEDAKRAELQAEEARLAQARDGMNVQFLKANEDREKAEVATAAIAAKVKRLAVEWNIPEANVKDILGGAPEVQAPPQQVNGPVQFDASKFVPRDEYNTLKDIALRMPELNIALTSIARQHQQLFGECPPDLERKLLDEARKQQRPIEQVWDNLYGVNEKRQAAHDTQVRQEERAKVETEWKAKLSAASVGTMPLRPEVADSPVFKLEPLNKNRPAAHGAAHAASSIGNAVTAFNSGKYKRPEFAHQE